MNKCLWCQIETNNPKFCSLSCGSKYQFSLVPKFTRVAYCKLCEKPYKYNSQKVFCGKSCSATFNNKNRAPKSNCLDCSKVISGRGKEFCSIKCAKKYKTDKKISDWKLGLWSANSSQGVSSIIRKYLIIQSDNKCTKCGWNEINPVTGRVPLEINHIDGDSENNRPDNLEVICPNCHSLTPNFRALNKNSKRKYRKSGLHA